MLSAKLCLLVLFSLHSSIEDQSNLLSQKDTWHWKDDKGKKEGENVRREGGREGENGFLMRLSS